MRFPANCLVVALLRGGVRTRMIRNRFGHPHFYWRDGQGLAREFWAPNRAGRGLLRNAVYMGRVRRCPSLDLPGAA